MGSVYLATNPEGPTWSYGWWVAGADSDLTPRGVAQAEKVAALIASRAVIEVAALFPLTFSGRAV